MNDEQFKIFSDAVDTVCLYCVKDTLNNYPCGACPVRESMQQYMDGKGESV